MYLKVFFLSAYLSITFLIGVVLPIYLMHIKANGRDNWLNLLPIVFITALTTVIDMHFFSKYSLLWRTVIFFVVYAISLLLTVFCIYYGHRLLYGQFPTK